MSLVKTSGRDDETHLDAVKRDRVLGLLGGARHLARGCIHARRHVERQDGRRDGVQLLEQAPRRLAGRTGKTRPEHRVVRLGRAFDVLPFFSSGLSASFPVL